MTQQPYDQARTRELGQRKVHLRKIRLERDGAYLSSFVIRLGERNVHPKRGRKEKWVKEFIQNGDIPKNG